MAGFLRDLYLRPSCHDCPSKSLKSGSDITIADFWGIENVLPEFDDDKGVSLLMTNTQKGESELNKLEPHIQGILSSYEQALRGNPMIEENASVHRRRDFFFNRLDKQQLSPLIKKTIKLTFREKLLLLIKRNIVDKFLTYGK